MTWPWHSSWLCSGGGKVGDTCREASRSTSLGPPGHTLSCCWPCADFFVLSAVPQASGRLHSQPGCPGLFPLPWACHPDFNWKWRQWKTAVKHLGLRFRSMWAQLWSQPLTNRRSWASYLFSLNRNFLICKREYWNLAIQNQMEVPHKAETRVAVWSCHPTAEHISGQNCNLKSYMQPSVHCSTVYNSKMWKQTKCSPRDDCIKKM